MRAALRSLRLPGFTPLTTGYWTNELGNWLGEIALAVLVFDQTGSPLAVAGLFLGTQFLPAFVVPPLVARLEALSSSRSLPLLFAAEAGLFAALGFLSESFVLALVVALAALDGALASAARSLTRAAAAAILSPRGLLREGNAVLNLGFTASAALGPAIAGLVVAGAGVQVALYADAVSFAIVAVMLAATRLPRIEIEEATWGQRLRAGLRYVRERPVLSRLLAAEGAAFLFFYMVVPIVVVLSKETLDAGDSGYGALLASWGSGMVVGSVVFAALRGLSLRLLLATSTVAIGCAYLGTAAAPTLLVACIASVAGGIGNGVQWVTLLSAVQELTSTRFQARVIAMLESIGSVMPGLGFVLGGAIAAVLSPRASYAVAGAGVLVVVVVATFALARAGWRGESSPPAVADAEPA